MPKNHKDIKLTQRQQKILEGTMLGDAWASAAVGNGNCHVKIEHSMKQQGWLKWKHDALRPFVNKIKPVSHTNSTNTRTYKNCYFTTIQHPRFTELENEWYQRDDQGNHVYRFFNKTRHRIKIVPADLILTPLSLAVWYIDDGCNMPSHKECKLATMSFTQDEIERLAAEIKSLGITDCWSRNKDSSIIIGSHSYLDFIELVKIQIPDMPNDVLYKVDISKVGPTLSSKNRLGIPNVVKKGDRYHAGVWLNRKRLFLGSYVDEQTARAVSSEIEVLRKQRCKDEGKFIKIRSKYKSKLRIVTKPKPSRSGIPNFRIDNTGKRTRYIGKIKIGKTICLGTYYDQQTAWEISNVINELRNQGCTDINEYQKIKHAYADRR